MQRPPVTTPRVDLPRPNSEVARFIPGDILYNICEATEDEGVRNVVDRKHGKNLNILSMMGVCKSWNGHIRGLKGLFADIAFDTADRVTISTATRFLEAVEARTSNLRVYARCRDQGDTLAVSETFLSRLRLHSWRFVCFEAEHMSDPFIAYFNLPAPRLLRLVHKPAQPEGLFASSFTRLRVLDASVNNRFPWPTATLSNLVVLRLKNTQPTRRFCATSLIDLIKRTHLLEELKLTNFLRFSGGSGAKPVVCANLKSIHIIQCDLKFILQHLQFPNTVNFYVDSYGVGLDGEPDPPPSKDTGYFAPLQALAIPVLDQCIVTGITIYTQDHFTNKICVTLSLRCEAGRTFDFTVTFRKEDDWATYFHSSVNEMLRRIRLAARVSLLAFHHLPLSPMNHPSCQSPLSLDLPLLRLPQVSVLRTDYPLVQSVILHLPDPEPRILPNLKFYSFKIETQPSPAYLATPETLACLRSRFNDGSPIALQYWMLDDAGWINTTTTLIEESLPVLLPFLKGIDSGFMGDGGYLVSGLYVERLTFKL